MSNRIQRRAAIKKIIRGTADRPRLVVFRSNRYFYCQLVDDANGKTIAAVNKITDPKTAGEDIARQAEAKKITQIVFDRAGYKYHGNVKILAEAVRNAGLKF